MTTITIYNPSGKTVYDTPLNKGAKVFRKLGGDYYVELSFNVAKTLDLPKGSYIEISDPKTNIDVKYALKSDASPEPMSGATGYKYVLKFYAGQHEMEHCQVKWQAGDLAELSFRLTTSLKGYAKLIADNMNAYLESDIWAYDESLDDADMQEQSFEGISCWDAINNIANTFGVEWWVSHGEKLTIHFGKCENEGNATEIREGEIVNRFPAPKRGDDSNYGTRFYIFGGTQNVPDDYRGNDSTSGGTTFHISEKRICLQEFSVLEKPMGYLPYYDVIGGLPNGAIVEKTIILDDIFPKNETTIGTEDVTRVDENIIEGQEPQPVYYIKVANKPTLLSTLGITFTTGALAGRSFGAAIVEKNNTYQIKINHITEKSGGSSVIAVPNANLAPKAGDKYILTGVKLSNDRIEAAERELWKKGTELARQRANDTNVYDCPTNPEYCHKNGVNLDLGDKVILKGAHFGETGRKSRVQGYEKLLYAPYVATYNIGDNSVYSRTLKVYKDLNATVTEAIVAGNKNITPTKGEKGEPGNFIEYRYRSSNSAENSPSLSPTAREPYSWSTTLPIPPKNFYIWQITATINGATNELVGQWSSPIRITPINGIDGKPGVSISNVEVEYVVINNNNTPPDNNVAWSKDVPVRGEGQYIWSRTKTYYSEGNPTTSDPACISGEKGETGATGTSITTVDVEYAISSSNTTAPTTGWSTTAPQWENEKYIWSRTKTTYSVGSPTTTEAICVTGAKGETGATGGKGDAGRGVSSIAEQYYLSTSATSLTGGSWSATRPTWVDGKYIWTRSVITFTDGTTSTTEAICVTGAKGETGATLYTWIKYSDVANPTTSSQIYSTPKETTEYIGIAVNQTSSSASTSPSSYTWSKFRGGQGIPGDDGATLYTWIKYADDANGSGISDNPEGKLYIGLAHNKTTATESNDPADYTWSRIKGDTGDDGPAGNFVEFRYAVGTATQYPTLFNSTRNPTGWSKTQPTPTSGRYIWQTSATIVGDTDTLLDAWSFPIRITPVDGTDGKRGPALRGPQNWNDIEDGYQFYSGAVGEPYLDVVFYDNNCYLCKVSHTKETSSTPDNNSNWQLGDSIDLVATKLLLAKYSVIKNLGVEAIEMFDEDGNVVLKAREGNVECNGGSFNNITVGQARIGAWELSKDGLNASSSFVGYSDTISCSDKVNGRNIKLGSSIGVPEPEAGDGVRPPLIALDSTKTYYGTTNKAYGIYINVQAAKDGVKENIAIDLEGGCIKGLAMLNYVHNLDSLTNFTITRGYNNIIITGTGGSTRLVGMPKLEDRHNGYVIRIKNLATQSVSLQGSCFVDNDGTAKKTITLASKAVAEFVWVTGLSNTIDGTTYESAWVRYK